MINLLNKIIKTIITGDIKSLDKLVKTLYDHTLNKYFKLEEDLMIKYNCPGYDEYPEYLGDEDRKMVRYIKGAMI